MTQLNQLYFVYFSSMLRSSHPLQDAHQPPGYLSLMCVVNMFLTFFSSPDVFAGPSFGPMLTLDRRHVCAKQVPRGHTVLVDKSSTRKTVCFAVLCCVVMFSHRWPLEGYNIGSICYPEVSLTEIRHS